VFGFKDFCPEFIQLHAQRLRHFLPKFSIKFYKIS
jgi:hypothetical protein